MYVVLGRTQQTARLAAVAEAAAASSTIALVRVALCHDGRDRMLADARRAIGGLPATSCLLPVARMLEGVAHMLLGDAETADECLCVAADEAEATTPLAAALAVTPHDDARIGGGTLERAL